MSSIFRSHTRELVVLASLSASALASGCNSGFSSCEELATCGDPSGEGGAGGTPDDAQPGAGDGPGTSEEAGSAGGEGYDGLAGAAGAYDHGAAGHAGSPDTSGQAGAGGNDGEGGAGPDLAGGQGGYGGEPTAECQTDAACDDGWSCNGLERCVDGSCEAGEPFECVSDTDGCEAVCEEQESGAGCVLRARDADGDGYASAQCVESPGDDCDDNDASVHAGAPELCDALDNDCDALGDLSDGLSLDALEVSFEGFSPSVVWSERHAAFGMLWTGVSSGVNQLRGGTLSTSGVLQPWPVVSFSSSSAAYLSPSLVANGGGFAALFQTGSRGGQISHLAEIDSDGTARSTALDLLFSDLAALEDGNFMIPGERSGSLVIDRYLPSGTERVPFEATPMAPRVAALGSNAAVIWQVEGTNSVEGLLYLDGVFVPHPFGTVPNAASPDVAPAGDGYAAAWITRGGVAHQRIDVDGNLPCVALPADLRVAEISDRALAIAGNDEHSFVLVADKLNGVVSLLRFDDECRLVDEVDLAAAAVPSKPSIAVGGDHVAACWSEGSSDNHSECRVMPVELCTDDAGVGQ